ncbi:predicted protein [Sclerotinia sclerotiorum 1980 UF-70]|uniref:Uncharacterized protein n=1 Tax=Sclerotinia sclerotiorum (strain ATCC 18683 / 1980 / Ss-1) TaxID=665079 RepID=A7EJS6_SCLS1|nr:predicted protein [Sclerotinia sclerotiorum 1980 UF-70]EDO03092.1 predicted protein [Sclerotinia sclerotiorum 1980 UF-70]
MSGISIDNNWDPSDYYHRVAEKLTRLVLVAEILDYESVGGILASGRKA